MTADHVDAASTVVEEAFADLERRDGREPEDRSEERRAAFRRGVQRFVDEDAGGAWVAVDGDTVIGMAAAIRRDDFWGLSLLFVHPDRQSGGVGRGLLDQALTYAHGATVKMIMSSEDPRAIRRYARAGLTLHPGVKAEGTVDRTAIPTELPGRDGTTADLDLVEHVDKPLRRSRTADVAFLLDDADARLEIIDDGERRGFVVHRMNRPAMLGATDHDTAAALLWRALAAAGTSDTDLYCLTAGQDWAVKVCLAARLKVTPGGPLFIDGLDRPPGPWLPSGWYF